MDDDYASATGLSRATPDTAPSSDTMSMQTASEATVIVPSLRNIDPEKTPKVVIWKDITVTVANMGTTSWKFPGSTKQADDKPGALPTPKRREILHGVSGVAEPGEVLAIMGASGAGKTSLLNVLTQRNLKGMQISGEMTINGEVMTSRQLQRMSSYVQQADLFMQNVTVREHLMLCARLRMGSKLSYKEKIARVDEVIVEMNLVDCQNTIICYRDRKSVSMGEKKRISFAAEMLTDPAIIFCDEPTSGLDAFMAKQVIKALKALAKQNRTVIVTIHQPSSQVFDMFSKLYLLALGDVIYLGPAKKVINLFKRSGFPMEGRDNPAEFCIEKLAQQDNESKATHLDRVKKIKNTYDESKICEMYRTRIHGSVSERRRIYGNEDIRNSSEYNASWFLQLQVLTVRSFRAVLRDPLLLKVRFAQTVITALIVGIVYFQMKLQESTILTHAGLMFSNCRDCIFIFLFPCVTVFTDEMPVFLRENHAHIYRTSAYYVAKNLAELPQYIAMPAIYAIIVFFMTGVMSSIVQLLLYVATCATITNFAVSLGYAVACVCGSHTLSMQVLPLICLPLLMFAGFFINLSSIPSYFKWCTYISYQRYGFEALMINMWSGMSGIIEGCDTNKYEAVCKGGTAKSILKWYTFNTEHYDMSLDIVVLLCLSFLCRSIAFAALVVRAHVSS